MKNVFLLIAATILVSNSISAEEAPAAPPSPSFFKFSGSATTRYRTDEKRKRFQERLILKLNLNLPAGIKLVAVGANGPTFNDGWNAFYDSKSADRNKDAENIYKQFSLRNLFLSKSFNIDSTELTVQLGALDTPKVLANITALQSQGWIDGVRVNAKTEFGGFTAAAGTINDLTETDFYNREIDFNYYEFLYNHKAFEKLSFEVGLESFVEELYVKAATDYNLALGETRAISLLAEALVNTEANWTKSSIGFRTDLMRLITGNKSTVKLEARHNHMSNKTGARGTKLTSGITTSKGDYVTVKFSGAFNEKKTLAWFAQFRENYDIDNARYEAGVKIGF